MHTRSISVRISRELHVVRAAIKVELCASNVTGRVSATKRFEFQYFSKLLESGFE